MQIIKSCAVALLTVICLFSCENAKSSIEQNGNVDYCTIHEEVEFNETIDKQWKIIRLKELPSTEEVFFSQAIPTTSFKLLLCKNSSDEYSAYVTENYREDDDKEYVKMEFFIDESMIFDEYKLFPTLMSTGGSGGVLLLAEFTTDGEKCYHTFQADISDTSKINWNIFIAPTTISNNEAKNIINNLNS